ncbi:glycosyltransferase family A protein [Clostridium perfringens]|uniref:glycosyltransferase family 2 protein n=1 Tax=Clostridium perfringens TaxID=1502 RepID=UPI000E19A225|nr:glycosyltransferase family A protein [Clostridium perfringens]MDM0500690.1 glycosyltransferase family A protein [Clostridium perfringens]MDM0703844.1 glycosyltransferase family A protein [Clostridium perfringens]SUY38075.1 beta-glycosyltransferase [Clostridium perfringens]
MKKITVFTPTYNRAYVLDKCYKSLKRQTVKDFIWLIIDDGSTDNTKEIVSKWIKENSIEIIYKYQSNQGMHGAHNTAYKFINTELNVCIDSDDYMPNDAIEKILNFWEKNKSDKIAGIAGLDAFSNGKIIGDSFPKGVKTSTLFDLHYYYKIKGDKKLVYRTDLTKEYPYPIFKGEKYVSLAYKYTMIDRKYELALMNEILCIVEYMQDGSSLNMLQQYIKNPKGFSFLRISNLKNPKAKLGFKFKQCIHYVSTSIISKNFNFVIESPEKLLTILAIPFGVILYMYIIIKTSNKTLN